LPNVGPYIYTTLAFLALLGAPYIYDISSLRVKVPTLVQGYGFHWIVRQMSIINCLYDWILANWYICTKSLASCSGTPP